MQTYEDKRVVVISDGDVPGTSARADYTSMAFRLGMEESPRFVTLATPEHYGHGDHVKNYWLQNDEAAQWVKVLDDDDWLAPPCVEEMMRLADDDVAMVTCGYVAVERLNGRVTFGEVKPGRIVRGQINWQGVLVNRAYCDGLFLDPSKLGSDYTFFAELAKRGRVARVEFPLAWYNSWRTDADRKRARGE
jgi:hypothetical protein